VEFMDGDSDLLHQQIQWPRIRKTELYSNAPGVTDQRLRNYLRFMELPAELAEQWCESVQHGEENAAQAFVRLRLLISNQGREGDEAIRSDDTDASVMPRLCSWLEPGHMQCPPWLESLSDAPSVHRRSMAPEGWDD